MSDPGPLREQLLPYLLARASHLVSAEFYAHLHRRGLTVRRWRLLAMLWDTEALTIGQLSDGILVEQSSTTRLVDRAVADGLVRKQTAADDRRRVTVSLTDVGRAQIADVIDDALKINRSIAEGFDVQKTAQLMDALKEVIAHFEAPRPSDEG